MTVTVINEGELRQLIRLDKEVIAAVEDGFTRLAQGAAIVPPIISVEIPENNGEVDIKTAYVRGLDSFAVKIASGFYGNEKRGLPVASGMMVVVSAETGFPEAVLIDNGYLTQVRTGAAGAIAAKYLAREKVRTAGIIGAGTQGRYQALGLRQVREFGRLMVYDIDSHKVETYASEMADALGVEVIRATSAEEVVRNSDVIITTTPSKHPYLEPEWLHPGLHITAMGADAEGKQELYTEVVRRVDLVCCDKKSQCFVRGELHHALAAGLISEQDTIIELGQLTSGAHPGRRHSSEVTLCDLTGVGVQDTAIALLAVGKARKSGVGLQIDA